ncbi:MAG: response regulator, partial [Gammaproteobacteria bacterium]
CQRLSDMMGGEIGVRSKPGEGSEFHVTLPFNRSGRVLEQDVGGDIAGLRVLLIVANETEQAIYRRYLEHWRASVTASASLHDCLNQCLAAQTEGKPFNIVVLGPQWGREEQIGTRNLVCGHSALPATRFVSLSRGKRRRPRRDTAGHVYLDVDLLRRSALLSALALATGRMTPEVYDEKEMGKIEIGKAPTVEQALKQGRLILVAEDNATNRDVVRRQLDLLGYACEMVDDGRQALEAWRSKNYALLLVDCYMPVMDGFELTDAIRQAEQERHASRTPILAITANALHGEFRHCLAAGMDDYMSKPINMKVLQEKLRTWMPDTVPAKAVAGKRVLIPPAQAAAVDPGNAPIDEQALKGVFSDDPEVFKEILNDFIVPSREIIGEIQAGWKEHCAEEIRQAAHKLKSSARSIGANELADLCLTLESAGEKQDWNAIEGEILNLDQLMDVVERYIISL